MAEWAYVLATADGSLITELTAAKDRKLVPRLLEASEASFSIDSRHPQASEIAELRTDLIIYRDHVKLFRGRIGSSDDDLGTDTVTSSFGAVDYRGLLDRRLNFTDVSFVGEDIADMAWTLIDNSQHFIIPGGNMGITRGQFGRLGIGTVRTHVVKNGTKVGESIDVIANTWGGFEWTVDPDLQFQTWHSRGNDLSGFAAVYGAGGNVVSGRRSVDTSEYANTVRQTGADGLNPAVRFAPDIATRTEGRFEVQEGNTDLTSQSMVNGTGDVLLSTKGNLIPSYQFTLAQGEWDPAVVWVGDTTIIHVNAGRLHTEPGTRERVIQLDIAVDENGGESVQLTYGNRRSSRIRFERQMPRRLERLERR